MSCASPLSRPRCVGLFNFFPLSFRGDSFFFFAPRHSLFVIYSLASRLYVALRQTSRAQFMSKHAHPILHVCTQ